MISRTLTLLVTSAIAGFFLAQSAALGQGASERNAKLHELRQRLGKLKEGMTAEEVRKMLGNPDEVRRLPSDDPLDDIAGPRLGPLPQRERWLYGVMAKGRLAQVGYVGLDRDGKVVTSLPTDWFARPGAKAPVYVPAEGERAVESPDRMSVHVSPIELEPRDGWDAQSMRTKITVKNAGTKPFQIKHDAAYSMQRFLIFEICDEAGTLLYREDKMSYHSPISIDPEKFPTLSITPGMQITEEVYFNPAMDFGSLPPGKYSARAYFPLVKGKLYPSNLVHFTVMPRIECKLAADRRPTTVKIGAPETARLQLQFEIANVSRDDLPIIYNSSFLEHVDVEVINPNGKRISKRYGALFRPVSKMPEKVYPFDAGAITRTGIRVFAACDGKDLRTPGIYKITAIFEYQNERVVSNPIEVTLTTD